MAKPLFNNEYYSGKRFELVTVGQRFNVHFTDNFRFNTDFESFMNKFAGTFFSPGKIYYGTGFEYKNFGWMHYCLRDLDKSSGVLYPIRNKFYIQW